MVVDLEENRLSGAFSTMLVVLRANEHTYIADHRDVKDGVDSRQFKCGTDHYLKYGRQEGRSWLVAAMATALVSTRNALMSVD
jgi:hypothetical protein